MIHYNDKGFTIIEMLVVIAIIAVLASIVLVSVNGYMAKARDARRKAEIKQISIALEMNYAKHGAYTQPENMCSDTSYGGLGECGATGDSGDWDPSSDLRDLISDGFMNVLPKDPINSSTYKYTYEPSNANELAPNTPGGIAYTLCATLETGGTFCISKRN